MPEDQMMQDIIPEDVPMEAGLQEPPAFGDRYAGKTSMELGTLDLCHE